MHNDTSAHQKGQGKMQVDTRAKARALRDFTNIGITCLEAGLGS